MCDCSLEEKHGLEERSLTTVDIFKKCSTLPVQHSDYANEPLQDARKIQHGTDDILIIPTVIPLRMKNDRSLVSSSKSSSDGSFNDSIQSDEFVNPESLQCFIDCEDATFDTECICEDESSEDDLDVEQTLAIIKPEAMDYVRAIENIIHVEGFVIQQRKRLRMTCEQVSEFYADCYGTTDFNHIVAYMASGPVEIRVLARKKAVQKWQLLMGPTKVSNREFGRRMLRSISDFEFREKINCVGVKVTEARLYFPDTIRARYGKQGAHYRNCVHGSSTRQQAEREIHFFFPDFIVEPLLREQSAEKYLRDFVNKVLLEGLVACCKVKPLEPILWLADWLLSNNPRAPKLA